MWHSVSNITMIHRATRWNRNAWRCLHTFYEKWSFFCNALGYCQHPAASEPWPGISRKRLQHQQGNCCLKHGRIVIYFLAKNLQCIQSCCSCKKTCSWFHRSGTLLCVLQGSGMASIWKAAKSRKSAGKSGQQGTGGGAWELVRRKKKKTYKNAHIPAGVGR